MPKKQKKYDIVTIGGATRDIMFYSSEGELISTGNLTKQKMLAFEYGAKISADTIFETYGGGSANTAVSFSKLGLKTATICRVGNDDNGKGVIKNLKNNGVDTQFIRVDKRNATGFSVILTVSNVASEHIIFLHRGANNVLNDRDLFLNQIESDWFHISSLPPVTWEKIITKVVSQKKNISWNPGAKQLSSIPKVKKILPKIKIFILNRDEALEFRKLKNIKGLLKYIHNLGPEIVVITDGEHGAYTYDGKKYYYQKARSTKNLDTVGVGDSFASSFTSAIIYGKTIKQAMGWGIKNSASVISQIGAQNGLLSRRQVEK